MAEYNWVIPQFKKSNAELKKAFNRKNLAFKLFYFIILLKEKLIVVYSPLSTPLFMKGIKMISWYHPVDRTTRPVLAADMTAKTIRGRSRDAQKNSY